MTQVECAAQLGLATHSHISNVETGRRAVSLDLVLRTAMLFGVSTDYLLRDSIPTDSTLTFKPDPSSNPVFSTRLLGAKIRYLRTEQGLSQTEMSRILSLAAHTFISLLESGNKEPSVDLLVMIADFFQVTTDALLDDAVPVEAVLSQEGK